MRASNFLCVLGLLGCAALVSPARGAPDDDKERRIDIARKLAAELQHLTTQGYRKAGNPRVERIGRRKGKIFPFEFKAATTYAIIAICGKECAHVQITLRDPQGTALARSTDKRPTVIVGGSAQVRGRYTAEVTVPGCREAECYAGVLWVELISAASNAAPAKVASLDSFETAPPVQYTVFDNYDVVSVDIARQRNVDAQACALACSRDARCLAYSFDKWNRWCFLKDEARAFRLEPNTVSGLRGGVGVPTMVSTPAEMQRYRNKGFPRAGGRTRRAGKFEECEDLCREDAQCVALTFFRSNSQCLLLESTGEYSPDSRADSAVKRQPPM